MRGFIALLAGVAAFIVPAFLIVAAVLGYADFGQATEMMKTWLAFIGPLAAAVVSHYFGNSNGTNA